MLEQRQNFLQALWHRVASQSGATLDMRESQSAWSLAVGFAASMDARGAMGHDRNTPRRRGKMKILAVDASAILRQPPPTIHALGDSHA